jgi:hypothetical protein
MDVGPDRTGMYQTASVHFSALAGGLMTAKTVAQKARLKPGTAIAVLDQVPGVVESLGLPEGVRFVEPAEAQLVFVFVGTRAELEARMPPAVAGLAPGAALWVFYRKGSKAAGLDMNRDSVWAIAEKVGIDDTWSAFRLRRA